MPLAIFWLVVGAAREGGNLNVYEMLAQSCCAMEAGFVKSKVDHEMAGMVHFARELFGSKWLMDTTVAH